MFPPIFQCGKTGIGDKYLMLSVVINPDIDITVKFKNLDPSLNPVSFVTKSNGGPFKPANPSVSFDVIVPAENVVKGDSIHPSIGVVAKTTADVEIWQNGNQLDITNTPPGTALKSFKLTIATGNVLASREVELA